jgi:hypothetical protein
MPSRPVWIRWTVDAFTDHVQVRSHVTFVCCEGFRLSIFSSECRAVDSGSACRQTLTAHWALFVPSSNNFYVTLLNTRWTRREWDGPLQYADPSGKLMMLPADMIMLRDAGFRRYARAAKIGGLAHAFLGGKNNARW